jgi:hypothetical protein
MLQILRRRKREQSLPLQRTVQDLVELLLDILVVLVHDAT